MGSKGSLAIDGNGGFGSTTISWRSGLASVGSSFNIGGWLTISTLILSLGRRTIINGAWVKVSSKNGALPSNSPSSSGSPWPIKRRGLLFKRIGSAGSPGLIISKILKKYNAKKTESSIHNINRFVF